MRSRCTETAEPQHKRIYFDRGIRVCERWLTFANFLADMGERPVGQTLDRIDVNGNYEPGNCRWATSKEQGSNKRTVTELQIKLDAMTLELAQYKALYGVLNAG